MTDDQQVPQDELNARQRAISRQVGGQTLPRAVRMAVFGFFRFTHANDTGDALWSERQRVWLGKKTFMHWAMLDPTIDIPRTVKTAADLPATPAMLRTSIRRELQRYWFQKLKSLPRRAAPGWMPLP